jgi:hypothetical protein
LLLLWDGRGRRQLGGLLLQNDLERLAVKVTITAVHSLQRTAASMHIKERGGTKG